jgi:hypothetical protein
MKIMITAHNKMQKTLKRFFAQCRYLSFNTKILNIMKSKSFLIYLTLLVFSIKTYCQEKTHTLSFKISVAEEVKASFKQKGRLFIFIGTNPDVEPRMQITPSRITEKHYIFAKNFSDWEANETLSVQDSEDWATWAKTQECTFKDIPDGTYYIQFLWDQNFERLGINAAGNIYSKKQEIKLTASQILTFKLSEIIAPFKLAEHKLVKLVNHKSDTLSRWWGKPVYERAAVLLPSKYYENPGKEYPIRYNVIWGFGSLTSVNSFVNDTTFFNWWLSDEAPQIITVYLDGELNGNIYHVDSDNKGPFGYSLINEFIPYIENLYRGTDSPATRFTDGCSTGGWGSLALQLFYPETFNGVFSYSPDPVSYKQFFTFNMYKAKNIFYNEFGYQRPVARTRIDNLIISFKDWVKFENVLGYSDTYIDSDRNLGVLSTIFGAKGADGKPIPLFDYKTGIIDTTAVESWSRYDLAKYVTDNWATIGSKLQGKIYIWAGTQDPYFLNNGVLGFEENLLELENPKSDAIIEFSPNKGHCDNYSNRRILEQIVKKLDEMNK